MEKIKNQLILLGKEGLAETNNSALIYRRGNKKKQKKEKPECCYILDV